MRSAKGETANGWKNKEKEGENLPLSHTLAHTHQPVYQHINRSKAKRITSFCILFQFVDANT